MAGRPEKYCWWFRNPARKPVLHGNYISIMYMVSFMSGGAGFLPTVFLFYWDPCKCKFDTRSILSPFYQDYGYSRNLLASILLKSIPFCSCLTCSVTHWWIWMFKMLWVRHDKTLPRNTIIIFERTRNLKRTHLKESFEVNPTNMILIQITVFFDV